MRYSPGDHVTVAEAVTLAVRLNDAYNGKPDEIGNTDGVWYEGYVKAAIERGVIRRGQFEDFDAPASRRQIAVIMRYSVPSDWLTIINKIKTLPDVDKSDPDFEAVRRLYNAGVVQGVDDALRFFPDSPVTRAETAAIINRIAVPENRKRIVTEEERLANLRTYDAAQIAAKATLVGCTSNRLAANGVGAKATASTKDPFVYFNDLVTGIDGTNVKTVRVGLKWDTTVVKDPCESGCLLFFTTADEPGWSVSRRIAASWDGSFDENGFADIVFDCASSERFRTRIEALRFDPFDVMTDFEIGYLIAE